MFYRSKGELESSEYLFLLTGGIGLENKAPNPAPVWLSEKSWDEICRMSDLKAFKDFKEQFSTNVEQWRGFYDSKDPHDAKMPEPWDSKLDSFKHLIVLRCIRPDKVI